MSEADAGNEICSLGSEYMENAPGLAWNRITSSIEFRQYPGRIRGTIECGDIRQTESFPAEPSIWRAIATFLVDSGWGTPWEADFWANSEVLEPWQTEVIQLCWLRDDNGRSKWGELVLSLPDPWLETAYDEYEELFPDMELLHELSLDGDKTYEKSWELLLRLMDIATESGKVSVEEFARSLVKAEDPIDFFCELYARYMDYRHTLDPDAEESPDEPKSLAEYLRSPRPSVICSLGSEYDTGDAPGLAWNWTTSIEFRKYRGRIRGTIECDDIRQTESFPAKPSIWRAIAKFLLYSGWGTPWEADASAYSDVLEPWQTDVIQLCWLRDEDGESKWGEFLLSLPDAWLEAAYDEYGTLLPDRELLENIIANDDVTHEESWELLLWLMSVATDSERLSVGEVAECLGKTEDNPIDFFRELFARYKKYMRLFDPDAEESLDEFVSLPKYLLSPRSSGSSRETTPRATRREEDVEQ